MCVCVCVCVCVWDWGFSRASEELWEEFKEEFRGENRWGWLTFKCTTNLYYTLSDSLDTYLHLHLFILQYTLFKDKNNFFSRTRFDRRNENLYWIVLFLKRTTKYKNKSKIVCGCKTRNTIRTNKCSINVDFETNFVEVNRHCFDIARDEPISIHNVSRAQRIKGIRDDLLLLILHLRDNKRLLCKWMTLVL